VTFKHALRRLLFRVLEYFAYYSCSPGDILRLVSENQSTLNVDILCDILPSSDEIDEILQNLPPDPADSSLAVLDPYLPPLSFYSNFTVTGRFYDSWGYSTYARVVYALLQILCEDRQAAKHNFWALRHFLALSLYAEDLLQISTAVSSVFEHTPENTLRGIVTKVHQITTYLLTSPTDSGFHLKIIAAISGDKLDVLLDPFSGFIADLVTKSKRHDNVRESRILRRVLQPILSNVSREEADQWMVLAKQLETTGG